MLFESNLPLPCFIFFYFWQKCLQTNTLERVVGRGVLSKKIPKTFCGASRQNMYNKNARGGSGRNVKFKIFIEFFVRLARIFILFCAFLCIISFCLRAWRRSLYFLWVFRTEQNCQKNAFFLVTPLSLAWENIKKRLFSYFFWCIKNNY